MKLLADANIESAIVHWLRAAEHDVVWEAELSPSYPDDNLLTLANAENRLVVTYDRDFGELIFRQRLVSTGVVLLRFDAPLQMDRLASFRSHWQTIELHGIGHFMVVSDSKVRIRPLP